MFISVSRKNSITNKCNLDEDILDKRIDIQADIRAGGQTGGHTDPHWETGKRQREDITHR